MEMGKGKASSEGTSLYMYVHPQTKIYPRRGAYMYIDVPSEDAFPPALSTRRRPCVTRPTLLSKMLTVCGRVNEVCQTSLKVHVWCICSPQIRVHDYLPEAQLAHRAYHDSVTCKLSSNQW